MSRKRVAAGPTLTWQHPGPILMMYVHLGDFFSAYGAVLAAAAPLPAESFCSYSLYPLGDRFFNEVQALVLFAAVPPER